MWSVNRSFRCLVWPTGIAQDQLEPILEDAVKDPFLKSQVRNCSSCLALRLGATDVDEWGHIISWILFWNWWAQDSKTHTGKGSKVLFMKCHQLYSVFTARIGSNTFSGQQWWYLDCPRLDWTQPFLFRTLTLDAASFTCKIWMMTMRNHFSLISFLGAKVLEPCGVTLCMEAPLLWFLFGTSFNVSKSTGQWTRHVREENMTWLCCGCLYDFMLGVDDFILLIRKYREAWDMFCPLNTLSQEV